MKAKTTKNSKTVKITKATLATLPTLGRDALKAVHELVTGEKVFGSKADILEHTIEAVREYLGIDE